MYLGGLWEETSAGAVNSYLGWYALIIAEIDMKTSSMAPKLEVNLLKL
jgi:hypothetical protein